MNFSQIPLAERMRPKALADVIGQPALTSADSQISSALAAGNLGSVLFWGPPGVGKTTLARVLAQESGREIRSLSAVQCGVKDLREAVASLPEQPAGVLFIDEVHRFNKAQQDALLPWVESGRIVFVGATTENPSFSINRALLSRVQVLVLKALSVNDLIVVLQRALTAPQGLGGQIEAADDALKRLAELADGDARRALVLLESALRQLKGACLGLDQVEASLKHQPRAFDKGGDQFYELISALHKSVRGSDPDAAVYYLARMMDAGCDPRYIARRLIRMASEDIGNADPRALGICVDAAAAYERLGSPEGDLALAHAAIFLACAAKSNAVEVAWIEACASVKRHGSLPVPEKLRNAPTDFMRDQGYGAGYRYAHNEPENIAWGEHYLPEELQGKQFYPANGQGLEPRIREKLERIRSAQLASLKKGGHR